MYKIGVSTPCAIDEEMFKLYSEAHITHMEVSVDKEKSEALNFEKLLEWSKKYCAFRSKYSCVQRLAHFITTID